ncbi:hypothetical protein AHF37_10712 [Paragonimus kellicotti]|nr:hypothetical protein AHF37_10712 [Paragonimus kellicotti]
MEKAKRTVEESKQRYERAGRILSQVMERLNRFFRANQADIEVRMLRDFNRLAYMLYEKCLKTSSVPNEELLAVEHQISESLNLRKPSVLSFRFGQRPSLAKRVSIVCFRWVRQPLIANAQSRVQNSNLSQW